MTPLVVFPKSEPASPAEVGGKAYSLIRMTEAGLPVPPGAVLTTAFFAPWFAEIKATPTWATLVDATPDRWSSLCQAVKELSLALPLTPMQRHTLAKLREHLTASGEGALFAVRSSSPEEDLTSASFAGGYETRLGVRSADFDDAVRHCFASSLDERVLVYKKEHGFDVSSPQIAVVVQEQIDSEVSGVGFSLNPLTNDYDEAVIDANWGLGESVVGGRVSPDHFVIDKVGRRIVETTLGAKQVSIGLDADGGTVERDDERSTERTLSDAQLRELTDVLCQIEALYDMPVDVEWAYAASDLHVLQARPITTYVPLPPEMVTRPGERRQLYADAALSKGLTTNEPVSPLGLDEVESMFSAILESWVGTFERDVAPEEAFFFFAGGRMYINCSGLMWLAGPRSLAKSTAPTDALMADTLAGVDADVYRAATRPPWVSARLLWFVPRILWSLRGFFANGLYALFRPEHAHRAHQRTIEAFKAELRAQLDGGLALHDFRRTFGARMARELFDVLMPAVLAGAIPPGPVVYGMPEEAKALADRLTRGARDNVVVEMGIALYHLAKLLDPSDFDDIDRLAHRIEQRRMPAEFLNAWDDFLANYGWRGPNEMDLASPRYADDPRIALRQMSYMSIDDDGFDPQATHQRVVEERQRAYEVLMRRSGPLRRMLLRRVYRLIDLFAGARDTPKHILVLFNYVVRRRALDEGRRLTRKGRLDAAAHVFDLTFDDLEAAARDPGLDLRALREERIGFRKKLDAHVATFPAVIDSRGRILRPPAREERADELRGMAVSPGVVRGPVKVLHTAHEKPVDKGDVLVAYTTDPGWTPLFVNAAAVVLEVGGVLQHGAVVAREYGKPCVVGIDRVTERLQDGQLVEVDGTNGAVRLVS